VLQCVAVFLMCFSVLQRVAVCCSVLQSVAVCCSVLQCVWARSTPRSEVVDVCQKRSIYLEKDL